MTPRAIPHTDLLDEIASLLAQGYLRLREKRARVNTAGQHSPESGDSSLDSIRLAERSLAGHQSRVKEDVHGDLT
jgi:hypothetical protein